LFALFSVEMIVRAAELLAPWGASVLGKSHWREEDERDTWYSGGDRRSAAAATASWRLDPQFKCEYVVIASDE
jgi:hypothetical protein